MSFRRDRINEAVKEALNSVIGAVKDPRVAGKFITVTAADVSGDLSSAKIYVSVLCGEVTEALKGLAAAKGFLRSALAKKLNLRQTPALTFAHDNSAAHGAKIESLLHELEGTET